MNKSYFLAPLLNGSVLLAKYTMTLSERERERESKNAKSNRENHIDLIFTVWHKFPIKLNLEHRWKEKNKREHEQSNDRFTWIRQAIVS